MKKEDIEHIIELFEKKDINKIRIKEGDFEIELEKQTEVSEKPAAPVASPAPTPINVQVVNEKPATTAKNTLNSPMVGTFYSAPSPGASSFVKVGQKVRKGEVIGIIEAMKIMNDLEAEYDCQISEILVADGQPIEFGMALFAVEKL
ncbi:acetyl-CoA carboxylase, biotin carboxyl carrier protein [Campylobacter pinnipediorum subsp. caledonicus]|uniref:Biotin carboxyl carrier protein of acetyl-CoA carboxylase n=1 Tax=Campylobacter pinnipediorum subsp. caledonicus TaxID=1874362 RepID=A0A1S6U5I3_9BACT|nr:acetyl-CoA carboxylase biotin carboxyl carrier protein [Campylobacter pinnipediorum]AQW85343.1 acetyl-CoA carboxylase, biotin carboxyl carrier protein [Campylobacter pinnipediorum subsp. caledonicus]AQW86952.1 acetyl-CoA carboxylase, biotin carboxyl carrier protein [Campylobacter pinnipediorum subsp. caledonicus]OPA71943.1 acetyl-CoA carboxylase, biotin carboxyl carrier protein [Campylobacter pinnipediorum subsp. caledonicus]